MSAAELSLVPPQSRTARELSQEFIPGAPLLASGNGLAALRTSGDDVERLIGADVYDEMEHDPQIWKATQLIKVGTLNDGFSIATNRRRTEEGYDREKRNLDFLLACIRRLQRPYARTLFQMMDALKAGNKFAEIVYEDDVSEALLQGKIVPRAIKVKRRDSVAYVVDRYWNLVGFKAARLAGGVYQTVAPGEYDKLIRREKGMVLSLFMENEDPRGRSAYRSVYNAWNLKTHSWPEFLRWLTLVALGTVYMKLPADMREQQARDPNTGELMWLDADQARPRMVSPQSAAMAALNNIRNLASIGIPNDSEIGTLKVADDGTPLTDAISFLDQQINTGLLWQEMLQRASKETGLKVGQSSSVFDLLTYFMKGELIDLTVADLFKPVLRINFGDEDADQYCPTAFFGDTERHNFSQDANAVATLFQAGYFTPPQLRAMDKLLGVEERSEGDKSLAELRQEQAQQNATGGPAPNNDSGPTNPAPNDRERQNDKEQTPSDERRGREGRRRE